MTPTRYRECLALLGLSQRGLAPVLGCSNRLTREWATGTETVPPLVGDWLETWVARRLGHPDPPPPESWRRRRSAVGLDWLRRATPSIRRRRAPGSTSLLEEQS